MDTKDKVKPILKRILRILPWALVLIITMSVSLVLAYNPDIDISAEELVEYAPKNDFLAAVFLIVLFALKSLIFIIPIPVLYIGSGLIFDPVTAFIVNVLGMIACTTLPYWIGWFAGARVVNKFIKKHPKLRILDTIKNDNEWFISFFVRAIGFLPCDAVSMILGAWKVDFKKYISGTILGMLPGLIATTLVGITITNPRSPEFILSIILAVLISVASIIFYRLYLKFRSISSSHSLNSAGADKHEDKEHNQTDNQQ